MPKKRVADIARERGLEPAEVARRLAVAGVKLSGDTVDEAAAARALGGSRPARNGKAKPVPGPVGRAAEPVAPHRPPLPAAQASQAPGALGSGRPARSGAPAGQRRRRASRGPRSDGPRGGGRDVLPPEGGGARPRPTAACGSPAGRAPARPQRGGQLGRRRRVVIDIAGLASAARHPQPGPRPPRPGHRARSARRRRSRRGR